MESLWWYLNCLKCLIWFFSNFRSPKTLMSCWSQEAFHKKMLFSVFTGLAKATMNKKNTDTVSESEQGHQTNKQKQNQLPWGPTALHRAVRSLIYGPQVQTWITKWKAWVESPAINWSTMNRKTDMVGLFRLTFAYDNLFKVSEVSVPF